MVVTIFWWWVVDGDWWWVIGDWWWVMKNKKSIFGVVM